MSSTSKPILPTSPLLHAWHDPLAGLRATPSCLQLADLDCDGDSKLCICDLEKKLKVYKGTTLAVEYGLLDVPVAMSIIYTEVAMPRIPSIAIAAASYVFIYRQLRPYRKWSCPFLDIVQVELDIWSAIKSNSLSISAAVKQLHEARDTGIRLSSRSIDLLSLESDDRRREFAAELGEVPFNQSTLITCMGTLKKESDEIDAINLLVVGTEAGQLYVLPQDPINSAFLCKIDLPSIPTLLNVSGTFDVEWRVSVVCRDGKLYTVKNGDYRGSAVLSGAVTDLGAQAVAVVRQDKFLWVATMDRLVTCYTNKGKRLKGLVLAEDLSDLCIMTLKRAKVNFLLVVALHSGEVCIYRELTVVHSFKTDSPVVALCYGQYGREEHSLILVHSQGALTIKMWKRTADIEHFNRLSGPPPEQDVPLPVPKKTKLYVEQTQRERERAPDIHRAFQRDLCKLRLTTARAYVKTLTDGSLGAAPIGSQDIRIQVAVHGLGPKFVLRISLQNASVYPILQSRLVLSFDPALYCMGFDHRSLQNISVPVLLPGPKQIVDTQVLCVDPQGRSGQILVLLYSVAASSSNSSNSVPMLSAMVKMPTSEPSIL